jgi:GGDEF domain-containing protein
MLLVAALAYTKSLRRLSVNAALATLASAVFILSFLGWISFDDAERDARFLAVVACTVSVFLAWLLLEMMGSLRHPRARRTSLMTLTGLGAVAILIADGLPAREAQALGVLAACLLGLAGLILSVRNALRGDRLAWMVVVGVFAMLVAISGLGWIATDREAAPWQVHIVSSVAATLYVVTIGAALWNRYAYLVELHRVMALGPGYDPVTRMRSHSQTSSMVGEVFMQHRSNPAPLGLIVVSIANLGVLEKLYGLAAVNHALFVCAGRLRRAVPEHVEMGRLGDESFLLLMRNCNESGPLIELAHAVQACVSKGICLKTGIAEHPSEARDTDWAAEAGTGLMRVCRADARAATAVAMARGMSRTAWSYPSRVAWYDERSGEIVGMPVLTS